MSSAARSLPEADLGVIERCLRAAVHGPFFPDESEFDTIFGLTRTEVEVVLTYWPDLPDAAPHGYESALDYQHQAVLNAMNNLLGYPHGLSDEAFVREVGATKQQVASAMAHWMEHRPS